MESSNGHRKVLRLKDINTNNNQPTNINAEPKIVVERKLPEVESDREIHSPAQHNNERTSPSIQENHNKGTKYNSLYRSPSPKFDIVKESYNDKDYSPKKLNFSNNKILQNENTKESTAIEGTINDQAKAQFPNESKIIENNVEKRQSSQFILEYGTNKNSKENPTSNVEKENLEKINKKYRKVDYSTPFKFEDVQIQQAGDEIKQKDTIRVLSIQKPKEEKIVEEVQVSNNSAVKPNNIQDKEKTVPKFTNKKNKKFSSNDERGRQGKRQEKDSLTKHKIGISRVAAISGTSADEDISFTKGRRMFKQNKKEKIEQDKVRRDVWISPEEVITISELASKMSEKATDLIKRLMMMGEAKTINQPIDYDHACFLVESFGHKVNNLVTADSKLKDYIKNTFPEEGQKIEPRNPIVTIMGHIDHGKTSILDALRNSDVVNSESGGITQHVSAYQISVNGKTITFFDTPGHAAFSLIRERGAKITDIVVIVVSAEEGVKEQTIEAIQHVKAANVPIIVAANKIDKYGANIDIVKNSLLKYGVIPEDMGGDVVVVPVSAKTKQGLPDLVDAILVQAEFMSLTTISGTITAGIIVETRIEKSFGIVAMVLITSGTLCVGDYLSVGNVYGKIRKMFNDKRESITKASVCTPVEIIGLTTIPEAGNKFYVVSEKVAKEIANLTESSLKVEEKSISVNDNMAYFEKLKNNKKEIKIIIKADVRGSIEAIQNMIAKLPNDEINVVIVKSGIGGITESDVSFADISDAIIIGFNVREYSQDVKNLAKNLNIQIKHYSVIYHFINDIREMLEGMIAPTISEKILGNAVVRQIFNITKVGKVMGSYVQSGIVKKSSKARVIRNGIVIHSSKIGSLCRGTDHVKEAKEGFECGITVENYDDIKVGDLIESFEEVIEKGKLKD